MELVELKIDSEFFGAFKKLLIALKDYNKDVVVIGGFANALYEYHKYGQPSPLGTLSTKDIDLLTSQKVSILNEPIVTRLKSEGFVIDYKPVENKVITKFTLPNTNFEIEFLCPMFGGDPDRNGDRQLVKEIQVGIQSQPLRYLDLVLLDPWIINSESIPDLVGLDLDIQIPNPGAYLIQKFLIKDRRPPNSIQKDCFYTYELLLKFNNNLQEVYQTVGTILVTKSDTYTKLKNFETEFRAYYKDEKSEGVVRIMRELKDRGHNDLTERDVLDSFEDFFIFFQN